MEEVTQPLTSSQEQQETSQPVMGVLEPTIRSYQKYNNLQLLLFYTFSLLSFSLAFFQIYGIFIMGSARSLKHAIYLDGYKHQSSGYVAVTCHIENPRLVSQDIDRHQYVYGCGTDVLISVPNDEDPTPWKQSVLWQEIHVDDSDPNDIIQIDENFNNNNNNNNNNNYNNYYFKQNQKNYDQFNPKNALYQQQQEQQEFVSLQQQQQYVPKKRILKFLEENDNGGYQVKVQSGDNYKYVENATAFLGFLERDFGHVALDAEKICRPFYARAYKDFPGSDPIEISKKESFKIQCYAKPMNNDEDIEDCFCIQKNIFYTSCQALLSDEYACLQESANKLQNKSWWVYYRLQLIVVVGWISLFFPFLTCFCGYLSMRQQVNMGAVTVIFGWALIINYFMFVVYCVLLSIFNKYV